MIILSETQKEYIKNSLTSKKDVVLYQIENFPEKGRFKDTFEYLARVGDMRQLLFHGITAGGISHKQRRHSNWLNYANKVYQNSVKNPNLNTYMSQSKDLLVVVGKQYITIHKEGETSSTQVYFKDILKIRSSRDFITLFFTKSDFDKTIYSFVKLPVRQFSESLRLLENILVYIP